MRTTHINFKVIMAVNIIFFTGCLRQYFSKLITLFLHPKTSNVAFSLVTIGVCLYHFCHGGTKFVDCKIVIDCFS